MKVLFICKYGDEIEQDKYENLNNISSVYGYFFYKTFINYCKEKVIPLETKITGMNYDFELLDEYDYCFYLYNRGISLLKPDKYKILRSKIKSKILTIAPTSKIQGEEDCLLFFVGKQKSRTLRINLVSDPKMLECKQDPEKIRILVDHEYYGKKHSRLFKMDKTLETIESLLKFKKEYDEKDIGKLYKKREIEIIQINTKDNKGYSIINSLKDVEGYERTKATSFKNIYEIYNKSDIFVVTHPEAMGLSCVECNQAGCKVVSPVDYIKKDFSELLDIVYVENDNYNWEEIINSLDNIRTKRKVRGLTYYKAVRLIFKKLNL